MKKSESIKNLTKALLVAQSKMGSAVKGAKNPFFRSNYADLPTVMEVVKEPLNEAGIIVLQPAEFIDGRNFIVTTLIHAESGEFLESTTEVIVAKQNNPQDFGAAQTYARRFGLQSMLFIPAEDDDGNQATGRPKNNYTGPKVTTQLDTMSHLEVLADSYNKTVANSQLTSETMTEVTPLRKSSFRKTKASDLPTVIVDNNNDNTGDIKW